MAPPLHNRLQDQINQYLGQLPPPPPEWDSLLQAISDTYQGFDQSQTEHPKTVSQPEKQVTELQENERRLRSILNASPDGIAILDMEGRICMASPGVYPLFGLPPEKDLTGIMGFDFLVPEDQERAMANMALLAQNQQHGPIEYRAQRVDGSLFDVEINAQAIRNEDDQIQQFVLIIRDISERKQAETALRASEQEQRNYLRHSPYGIFLADLDGHYMQVNPAACHITGYSEKELLSMSIPDLQLEEDLEASLHHFHTLLKTGHSEGDLPFRPKSGERRWWHVSAVKISDTRILGFCNDITDQKQAELEILNLSKFPAENPNPVLRIRQDGQVLYSNTAGQTLLSEWQTEVGSAAPESWQQLIQQAMQSKTPSEKEETCGGRLFSVAISPVPEEGYANLYALDITDRKQAEAAERESQHFLERIINAIGDPIFVKDEQFQFVLVNDAFCTIMGSDREALTGTTGMEVLPPDEMKHFLKVDRMVLATGEENVCEEPLTADDGITRTLITKKTRYVDDQKTKFLVGTIRDITERKQADEALRESRQITDGIIDAMPIRIFWKDKDLKYLGCNQAFAKDAGFSYPEDLIGKDDAQMSWKRQAGLAEKEDRAVMRSKKPKLLYEQSVTFPDGKTLDLLSSKIPMRDEQGHISGVLGVSMDITERKEAERRFAESNARHRDIAANIPGVVYQLQFKRSGFPVVDYMSTGCEKLFERSLEGSNYSSLWFDHMPEEDLAAFHQTMAQATRYMQRWSLDFRIIRPDGTIKWLRGAANPQKSAKGRILWNGVVLDITEQKLAEEEVAKQLEELRRWQRATMGREGRISTLKREVNAMAARLGQPRPYQQEQNP
jgi:PAS domain S-box-containing protein